MGRTPDYMNVTFAGFAGERGAWVGPRGQQRGRPRQPRHVPEATRPRGPLADPHHRAPDGRPGEGPIVRRQPGAAAQGRRDRRPASSCAARASWPRWRRSPTRPPSTRACRFRPTPTSNYALELRHPDGHTRTDLPVPRQRAATPGPIRSTVRCHRGSTSRTRSSSSTTSRCPRERVFIDGDIDVYNSVMGPTAWWANIMQQTTIRALTKLEFAYGLASRMAEAVNDNSPGDHRDAR